MVGLLNDGSFDGIVEWLNGGVPMGWWYLWNNNRSF